MGKGHRDNHRARKKRGSTAFAKKAQRRTTGTKRKRCYLCGTNTRVQNLYEGYCTACQNKLGINQAETDQEPDAVSS